MYCAIVQIQRPCPCFDVGFLCDTVPSTKFGLNQVAPEASVLQGCEADGFSGNNNVSSCAIAAPVDEHDVWLYGGSPRGMQCLVDVRGLLYGQHKHWRARIR